MSSNGGTRHRWSRDGRELFYVEGGDTLMAVEVSTKGGFSASVPTRLFQHPGLAAGDDGPPCDVSADSRFLVIEPPEGGDASQNLIRVILNWFAEFSDREKQE